MRPATANDVAVFAEFHETGGTVYEIERRFKQWATGRGIAVPEDVEPLFTGAGYRVVPLHEEGPVTTTHEEEPDEPLIPWAPPKPPPPGVDRVPFPEPDPKTFEFTKTRALAIADHLEDNGSYGFAALLRMVENCEEVNDALNATRDYQYWGAQYSLLALIGHKSGMDLAERKEWYRIAEAIPLSQRLAGHIVGRLALMEEGD
jgi:hypothetical protein